MIQNIHNKNKWRFNMIIFNFDKIENNKGFVLVQKDKKTYLEMRGGLTPIKIVLTLVVFKFLSFFSQRLQAISLSR